MVFMSCFSINAFAYSGEKVTVGLNQSYDSSGNLITWNSNVEAGSKGQPIFHISTTSSSGTKEAYCIQPGTHLNYNDVLTESTSSGAWGNLSPTKKIAIAYAMTFGKDGNSKNLKGNSDEKYVATALVIWEIVKGYRNANSMHMECTNTKYRDAGSKPGSNIRYNYDVISKGLYNAKVIPSFTGISAYTAQAVYLAYDSSQKKWTGSITDTNKVLGNFNYAGTYKMGSYMLTVTQSGNKLTFSSNAPSTGTYTTDAIGSKNVKWPTGGSTADIVAYSDSSLQDCVGSGSVDPPWGYFKVSTVGSQGNDFYIKKEVWTRSQLDDDSLEESPIGNAETLSGWYFYVERTDSHPFSAIVGPTDDLGQTKKISEYSKQPVYNGTFTITELGKLKDGAAGTSKSDFHMPENYNPLQTSTQYTLGMDLSAGSTGVVRSVGYINYINNPHIQIIKNSDNGDVEGFYFRIYNKNNPEEKQIIGPTDNFGKTSVKTLTDKIGGGLVGTQLVIEELGKHNADGTYTIPPEFETPQPVEITLEADYYTSEKPIEITFYNICLGKFKIIKQDKQTGKKLAGATYAVYNSNAVDSSGNLLDYAYVTDLTTGSDGTAVSEDLPLKTYYLKEKKAPANYKLDNTIHSVTVTAGSNVTPVEIVLTDENITGSVTLYKQDNNGKALAGSEWALYTSSGTQVKLAQTGNGSYTYTTSGSVTTLATDGNGRLTVNNLPLGSYYFWETKAPSGYVLSNTHRNFTITESSKIVTVNVKNTPITGSVTLYKQDNSGKSLAGSEWTLYTSSGTRVQLAQTGNGSYTYTTSGSVTTLVTDSNGKLTVNNLPLGSYYFLETKAPAGFKLSTTHRNFTITESTQDVTVSVKNTPITGSVTLYKQDSNGNAIAGSEWALYTSNGSQIQLAQTGIGQYTYSESGKVTTLVTDGNGRLTVNNLPLGSYYFLETKAPAGFKLSTTHRNFTITESTQDVTVSVKNTPITGSVTLYKQDSNGNAIAGSEWELFKSNGTRISLAQSGIGQYIYSDSGKVTTLATNNSGRLTVTDLPLGSYYLVETKSPYGTSVYGRKIEFTVSANGEKTLNYEFTVKDDKIVMYSTGGNGLKIIYFAGFTMLAISIAVVVIYTIKVKKGHGRK